MYSQSISCSSITEQTTSSFVIFHQQLGCFSSDWHQHEWGQLIYAEKGCVHINCQGKKILIPGWYAVWIPANTNHEIWSTTPQVHIHSVCFPVNILNTSLIQSVAVFSISALLKEMIMHTEKWSHDQDNLRAVTFLQAVQDVIASEIQNSISVHLPSTIHPKLLPITEYLQRHLPETITFTSLANEFGLSIRTLSRLFAQELGIPFSTYRKISRIMRALEMIEMGSDNVSQLANDVGYDSVATFSNNFLEICGLRPLQFINSKHNK